MTQPKATSTPIYYRDLSPEMKAEVLREITKPSLMTAIDDGDDVTIGYWLRPSDYYKD